MVEILFTLVAEILPKTKSFTQSLLAIYFYPKTIRGKLGKITLECDVLFETRARFEPSLQ